MPAWLSRTFGVVFEFGSAITRVEMPSIYSGRSRLSAQRLWVCSGDELELLFPESIREAGLLRCKLQMMRSKPLEKGRRIGPMLAGGLTLRHYDSFQNCPSLAALKERSLKNHPGSIGSASG